MEYSDPIVLDVQLRIGDLYWIYFMQAARIGWFVRGYLAIGLIILVALVPEHLSFLLLFVLPPSVFVILVVIFYFLLLRPYLIARSFVRRGANVPSPIHYVFSQAGIDVGSAHSQTHHDWNAISMAKQTGHLFVLYLPGPASIVLPKRSFASSEQISRFQNLVKQNIANIRPI